MVGLFLIELEIFAVAAMKSGRKSMLQISDPKGNIVLLTEGGTLSQIDKAAFERTFGPLEHSRFILAAKTVSLQGLVCCRRWHPRGHDAPFCICCEGLDNAFY